MEVVVPAPQNPKFMGLWKSGWETEERGFQHYLFAPERARSLVGLLGAAALYPLFGLLDWVVYPESLSLLLSVRLFPAVLLVVLAVVVSRATTYRRVVMATAAGYAIPACSVALMCHLTEGVRSPYYAGIALCTVFVAAFLTWPVPLTVKSSGIVLASYFVPFVGRLGEGDWRFLSLHGAFLVGTTILVISGMRLRGKLAWQVYLNRQALAQRNRELAELHELKDRMFQNVSHELRTPLTLMLTPLQRRLVEGKSADEDKSWIREMYRNGMRLLKQIDDLLDLARLDADGVANEREPVEVGSFLGTLVDDLSNSVDAAGLVIELETPQRPVFYSLDRSHFERVLLNLLGNAVKFTPAGGKIVVAVATDERGLEVSVEDTGPGISLDQQEKIFDRFQQGESGTTRRYGGSGIGLALVEELVGLMGGTVAVESEVGRGSRFTVRFPPKLAVGDARLADVVRISAAGLQWRADREVIGIETGVRARTVAGSRGPKVLVAEDDDLLRRELVEILAPEHRVIAVATGREAFREALQFTPQVVVSDVMMPGMDGVELCRRLRERPELKGTAVVLLTAKDELEDRIEGRRVGADSYLTKPFDIRELLATIEGLLRARMHLVGDYLVQSTLGRGGQSEVWRAEQRKTGERVALKIIRPGGFKDARARERLRKEHEALLRLDHPNIVKIVARGEQAGGFFLAMEYLEGRTLDSLIREAGALPSGVVASIGVAAASALSHVHASGLIHRDLKCSNLMLLRGDSATGSRVRLIDFGTAATVRPLDKRSRRLVGSLPYLAPELLRSAAEASVATDIYGLGVVLHRLSTGVFPYQGGTVEEILEEMDKGPAIGDCETAMKTPSGLSVVIGRAMALDPNDRWKSCADLERALATHARGTEELAPLAQEVPTGATVTVSRSPESVTADL